LKLICAHTTRACKILESTYEARRGGDGSERTEREQGAYKSKRRYDPTRHTGKSLRTTRSQRGERIAKRRLPSGLWDLVAYEDRVRERSANLGRETTQISPRVNPWLGNGQCAGRGVRNQKKAPEK